MCVKFERMPYDTDRMPRFRGRFHDGVCPTGARVGRYDRAGDRPHRSSAAGFHCQHSRRVTDVSDVPSARSPLAPTVHGCGSLSCTGHSCSSPPFCGDGNPLATPNLREALRPHRWSRVVVNTLQCEQSLTARLIGPAEPLPDESTRRIDGSRESVPPSAEDASDPRFCRSNRKPPCDWPGPSRRTEHGNGPASYPHLNAEVGRDEEPCRPSRVCLAR